MNAAVDVAVEFAVSESDVIERMLGRGRPDDTDPGSFQDHDMGLARGLVRGLVRGSSTRRNAGSVPVGSVEDSSHLWTFRNNMSFRRVAVLCCATCGGARAAAGPGW